jgi:uncharacterized circularly permuted ATP-grasp superfamily protein/uncharacterized alpha-E superfamily protein
MDAPSDLDLVSAPQVHGAYDELRADGVLRPPWRALDECLRKLGARGMALRYEQARRLIRENGVTYNVYGDAHGLDRPWQLDPLPLMLAASEWEALARGIAQRARLIETVVADAYGPQRLLKDGHLDPALVFAHPAFLRPCHGHQPPGARWLHVYAADLVRGQDGAWRVLADRTQAPAGAGYALENRIVLSRALSDGYRHCGVQRLAGFFIAMRRMFSSLAGRLKIRRDNPRIVLLTPGPYNETYFEHAYLARYLGYTLVEGGDLTVRDDQVFLKTLGGLHRVDVILRRLDDDFCDPLELRRDSSLGVAGLVAAARAGNVVVANALGSGIGENAALMPSLPRLCRLLFGEDLVLPAVETLWGGDAAGDLRARFDELVIRPAFGSVRAPAKRGGDLEAEERQRLLHRLDTLPHMLVGQAAQVPSVTPVWSEGTFATRSLVLRVFAVASDDGGYCVMPGGLARIASENQPWAVSFQRGGGSKDAWVLADGPVAPVTLLRPSGAPVEFKRGGSDLPSRVADNLYWLGRYGARAEDAARVLRSGLTRLAGDQEVGVDQGIQTALRVLKHQGVLGKPASDAATLETQLLDLLFSDANPASLRSVVGRLHYAAFSSRDRLSYDTWRIINQIDQDLSPEAKPERAIEALPLLDRLVLDLAALAGMATENTTRGPGWRFLDLGRRLERATFTAELVRGALVPRLDDSVLDTVLEIADSAITYRARYLLSLQVPPVIDLLLCDGTNPRAMAFQLERIADHVAALPRAAQALPTPAERLALGAFTWVRLVDPQELAREDEAGERSHLAHVMDHLSSDLTLLSDTVTTQYLSHATTTRQPSVGPGE